MCAAVSLILIGSFLYRAPWQTQAMVAVTAAVALGPIVKLAWKGKTVQDLANEDAAAQGAGSAGNMTSRSLMVRPGWAAAAVGLDLTALFVTADQAWTDVQGNGGYAAPDSTAGELLRTAGAIAAVWLWQFCHRKATDPVRPHRSRAAAPAAHGLL